MERVRNNNIIKLFTFLPIFFVTPCRTSMTYATVNKKLNIYLPYNFRIYILLVLSDKYLGTYIAFYWEMSHFFSFGA